MPEFAAPQQPIHKPHDRQQPAASLGPTGPVDGHVPVAMEPRFDCDFSRMRVHSDDSSSTSSSTSRPRSAAAVTGLQAKLIVSTPGDVLEQEADHIAGRLVGGAFAASPAPTIADGAHQVPVNEEEVARLPGHALDTGARGLMESLFGRDFSRVRVHADDQAARVARGVGAHAFTVGSHIVFGAGTFAPATRNGRHLLAHELTHVVQQTDGGRSGAPGSIHTQRAATSVQRDASTSSEPGFVITMSGDGFEVEAELRRRGILKPGDYDSWGFLANGYYFAKGTGSGSAFREYRVLDALYVRDAQDHLIGYRIISYLHRTGPAAPTGSPAPAAKPKPAPARPTTPRTVGKPESAPVKQPEATERKPTQSTDEMRAAYIALPEAIRSLLTPGGQPLKPEDLPQLLRIAEKLKKLQPEDLQLYKLLAKQLAADLDSFERSVDAFIQFKDRIRQEGQAETKRDTAGKEPTLEEKLAKTYARFDEKKFTGMTASQKEDLARDIAAEQRNIQLEHMVTHPGQTALGMAEGMVRLDKTAKAIVEDVQEAADGKKSGYARLAGAVGAYNKYLAAAASIVFIALLFVPGVNVLELAAAGLAVAAASIALSVTESELRIKAAGQAKTSEEFKTDVAKAAAAQTQAVTAAAMLALTLVAKLVARIPLPGRLQSVGSAMKMARAALLEKSGVGPVWRGVKADLLSRLRASKAGLPEALAEQTKGVAAAASAVEAMSGDEFLQHLADGDPQLADLGISAEQAKGMQQLARTPEGRNIPQQVRQSSLQALKDAPVEAGKKVDRFLKGVDDAIDHVEKADSPEQLKSAVDDSNAKLGADEQARQEVADEQTYMKKRQQSARRSGLREQAEKKLAALQEEKTQTQAKINELETELRDAEIKVRRLREKALAAEPGSEARASATKELREAQNALKELREADELGGYREERAKQSQKEEAILESLELKRPTLWESTKAKIRAAAKRKGDQFLDANTGEVIEGQPVYGHKYGREHRRLVLEATEKGMSQEQFTQWVNEHPEWFQLETEANNLSHRFEKPGVD